MTLFEIFAIAALATYRWTLMVSSEAGPGHIIERFRVRVGVKFDQYSNPYGTNWISEGILCPFCLSVWVSFGASALLLITGLLGHVEIGVALLFPWAVSGVTVYLKKAVG